MFSLIIIIITLVIVPVLIINNRDTNKIPKIKIKNGWENENVYQKPYKKYSNRSKPYSIDKVAINPIKPIIHTSSLNPVQWDEAFLKTLEWKQYENVCMEFLRIKNNNAAVTTIGADGGIDIKIKDKNGITIAIAQCKAWSRPIGVSLIRELYGVMASENVKHGVFLTTSIFSQDAIEFSKNKALLLINGREFVNLINKLNTDDKRKIDKIATEGDYTTPTCVQCDEKMVKRIAKKGNNAGNEFWGCINYPRCKNKMFVKNTAI